MKRIVSLICILAMIVIPGGVSAAPSEAAEKNREESILVQLGFMDDDSSDKVTRLSLSESLVKMLSYDFYDSDNINPFTDTDNKSASYEILKSAYNLGILSGGAARPNDEVTYNEAVKMVVSALGYGAYAQYEGGYPMGYISVASRYNIIKGVVSGDENKISKNSVCKLLYNAINTDLLLVTGTGSEIKYSSEKGRNLLYVYHNILTGKGLCCGVKGNNMLPAVSIEKGSVLVDGILLKDSENGSYDYVGLNTEYYYDADDMRLKAIAPYRCNVQKIDAQKVFDYNNLAVGYDDNGREVRVKLSRNTKILFNGDIIDRFSPQDFMDKHGEIIFIDNDGDSVTDVVSIRSYDVTVVGAVDAGNNTIYDYYDNSALVLDVNSSDDEAILKDELGNKMQLRELSRGDVITYCKNKSGNNIYAVFSNTEIIGDIEQITHLYNGAKELVVDGEKYETTKNFASNEVLSVGTSGAFRLTTDRRIAAMSSDDEAKFAYIVSGLRQKGLEGKFQLKIFTAEGKMLVADFAERTELDGDSVTADAAFSALGGTAGIERQIIRYRLNDKGELIFIDTMKTGENESLNSLHRNFSSEYDENGNARSLSLTWRDSGMFGGRVPVNEVGPLFVVPKQTNSDDENYIVTTPYKYFVHDRNYEFDAYTTNRKNLMSDVLLYKSDTNAKTVDANASISVVDTMTKVLVDGMEYTKLSLYTKGVKEEYLLRDNDVLKIKLRDGDSGYHTLSCGDVIRFSANDAGYITFIELWYDRENDRFKYAEYENTSSLLANLRVAYGEIYSLSSGIIQFHKGPILTAAPDYDYEQLECYKSARYKIYTYDSKEKTQKLRLGGVYDMTDFKTAGRGTRMIVYCRNGFDGTIVLYK